MRQRRIPILILCGATLLFLLARGAPHSRANSETEEGSGGPGSPGAFRAGVAGPKPSRAESASEADAASMAPPSGQAAQSPPTFREAPPQVTVPEGARDEMKKETGLDPERERKRRGFPHVRWRSPPRTVYVDYDQLTTDGCKVEDYFDYPVKLSIDTDGTVTKAELFTTSDPESSKYLDGFYDCYFRPYQVDGNAVKVITTFLPNNGDDA